MPYNADSNTQRRTRRPELVELISELEAKARALAYRLVAVGEGLVDGGGGDSDDGNQSVGSRHQTARTRRCARRGGWRCASWWVEVQRLDLSGCFRICLSAKG